MCAFERPHFLAPVGVTWLDTSAAYRTLTESALTAQRLSEPSKAVLRRLGQLDRFDHEPAAVLSELHRGLAPAGDADGDTGTQRTMTRTPRPCA